MGWLKSMSAFANTLGGQLIFGVADNGKVDYARVRNICRRFFAYRKKQAWPPTVAKGTDWESVYNEENDKQSVLATVDEAVAWANELIGRIDEAE